MYKGFTVIGEKEDTFNKGKGLWLRHDRTGLQIVHFKTEDKKKFFSFNFKTPVDDDCGIPHILEHMIFCGSQKYPVKDIIQAAKKFGANEYINGYTQSFYTSYPVETYITKDYYNMLDIFGDAVFFPLLSKETFMQEGWHLELDEKDNAFVNGVVYNEMSDMGRRNYLCFLEQKKFLMQGSQIGNYPGGVSYKIPELSYEQVVEFHRSHYVPANCILFIYNHLDLAEQLDFLEKNLLSRLPSGTKEVPLVDQIIPPKDLSSIKTSVPYGGDKKLTVTLGFLNKDGSSDENTERDNFFSILKDEFVTLLRKNNIGLDGEINELGTPKNRFFMLSIEGVSRFKLGKAKKFLLNFVDEMYQKGISKEVVSCFKKNGDIYYDLEPDEVEASEINEYVVNGWVEQNDLLIYFDGKERWQAISSKYEDYQEEYFKSLIKKYFVENNNRFFLINIPDKNYYRNIDKKVLAATIKAAENVSPEEISRNMTVLRNYQQRKEDFSNFKEITVADLPVENDKDISDVETVAGKSGDITLFSSVQKVSSSTWVTLKFPIDVVDVQEFKYLEGMVAFLNSIGVNDLSYDKSVDYLNLASLRGLERTLDCGDGAYYCEKKYIYENRQWLSICGYIKNTDLEQGFKAFGDYIFNPNYSDQEAINLLKENTKNDLKSEDTSAGTGWESLEAYSYFGNFSALSNQLRGINSLKLKKEAREEGVDSIFARYQKLYEKIISGGAVAGIISNQQVMPQAKEAFKKFLVEREVKPLTEATTVFPEVENETGVVESTILSPVESGSLCLVFRGSKYRTKGFAADMGLLSWFSDSILHEYIRKQNGAYSVDCWLDGFDSLVTFKTNRDPNPKRSIELFFQCLKDLESMEFDEATVMQIIKSNYVDAIRHKAGYEIGRFSISRHLYGMKPEFRNERLKNLLALTAEDLHQSAVRLNQMAKDYKACIVTGDSTQTLGKIIWDYRKYT